MRVIKGFGLYGVDLEEKELLKWMRKNEKRISCSWSLSTF